MRSNLEDNRANSLAFQSGTFGAFVHDLTGNWEIPTGAPILHFYNGGLSDRSIFLPEFELGAFYHIFNMGTTNVLIVKNGVGTEIAWVYPRHSVQFYSDDQLWESVGHVFGPAGPDHRAGLVPDPGATAHTDSEKRFLREDGWVTLGDVATGDFIKRIGSASTVLTPSGASTVRFVSPNETLDIVAHEDDVTYGDHLTLDVIPENVDHDQLGNYVGDEHIDHTAVSVTTAASSGLAGGGNIASTRNLVVDLNNLPAATPLLTDTVAFFDISATLTGKATFSVLNGILNHNALLNYAADNHIAHSGVSINAGTGLTGGGDITSNRTIALDINGLAADTLAAGDFIPFYDIAPAASHKKITFANFNASLTITTSLIDNDQVTFAKMQNIATSTFLGRLTALTGDVEELTVTQATSMLNTFTRLLKGLVPPSGGTSGTANFLCEDGSWATPPGSGGGVTDGVKGDITVSSSGTVWTVAAASDTVAGKIEIAIQSEMETATDVVRAVTPGRVNFHPGVAKFWVCSVLNGSFVPQLTAQHNVTSVTDSGVGLMLVTIGTDFSSANWCAGCAARNGEQTNFTTTQTAGTISVYNYDVGAGNDEDPVAYFVYGFGDQ